MATDVRPATTSVALGGEEWALAPETPRRVALLRLARRNPLGVAALIIVLTFVFLGIFGPAIAPYDPRDINVKDQLEGPSWDHPFGTDRSGSDVLSRVLAGARISFLIGLMA